MEILLSVLLHCFQACYQLTQLKGIAGPKCSIFKSKKSTLFFYRKILMLFLQYASKEIEKLVFLTHSQYD